MNNTQYLQKLTWRYATKKYNPTKKLTVEQMTDLLAALRLAPSSFGLTPYRVYHIVDAQKRKLLQAKAFGQSPFVDASDLLVFAVPTRLDQTWVDAFFNEIMTVRGVTAKTLRAFKDRLSKYVQSKKPEDLKAWAARQAYIGLGFLLSAAAEFDIDATPMEGFDPAGIDEVLELASEGMTSVVCCALGFRAADDETQNYKKVRFPISELIRVK